MNPFYQRRNESSFPKGDRDVDRDAQRLSDSTYRNHSKVINMV